MLTKEQILELYLNQIFLGRNAYGVQAAARAYFDKDVGELTLAEAPISRSCPRRPSNYDPVRHHERALQRRNYVLGEMLAQRLHHRGQHEQAAAARRSGRSGSAATRIPRSVGGYFMEEVRRELIQRYRRECRRRPEQPLCGRPVGAHLARSRMQQAAAQALRDGLVRYESGRGWRDPGLNIDMSQATGRGQLDRAPLGTGLSGLADGGGARQGAAARRRSASPTARPATLPASRAAMPERGVGGTAFDGAPAGHGDRGRAAGRRAAMRCDRSPRFRAAWSSRRSRTGRVLAMQGGFDVRGSSLQPRHPGAAPARLDVQADRLCRPRSTTA